MKTMKALIFNKDKNLEMADVPMPHINENDEALIEIKYTGICGTDIHILGKNYPVKSGVILGHESSGIVCEIGSKVKNVKPGDSVILDPTYHCNICDYCRNNHPNYCAEKSHTETGVSSDGTFAEYHVANAGFLYPKPEEISFETATLTEPLSCMLTALRQTQIKPESRVLIVGAGPIGLLLGLAASSMGSRVTIGDIACYRLGHARELSFEVQDYNQEDILKLNNSRKFDLTIDTSGKSLEKILMLTDRGGEVLTMGLDYSYEAKIKPSYLTDNGIKIIGSIDSNLTFAPAIDMLKNHNEQFEKIITRRFPMSEYRGAFQLLGANLKTKERGKIQAGKVVLQPGF